MAIDAVSHREDMSTLIFVNLFDYFDEFFIYFQGSMLLIVFYYFGTIPDFLLGFSDEA